MDAVNGKYHDEKRIITREEFEEQKDTDAYVKYIWSFGNNGSGYLWGKNIEEIKALESVKNMPCYPNKGAIEVIDDVVVVKFSDYE